MLRLEEGVSLPTSVHPMRLMTERQEEVQTKTADGINEEGVRVRGFPARDISSLGTLSHGPGPLTRLVLWVMDG